MNKCKESFLQKPILCAFPKPMFGDTSIGDAHNSEFKYDKEEEVYYYSYLDASAEKCVGFVPHDSVVSIEKVNGENWITLTAIIWKQYHYELVKDILKKKRIGGKTRVSVEIEVEDSNFNEDGIEILNSWRGLGITILNDNVQEAIVGANLVTYEQSEKYEKYKLAMSFAYNGDNMNFIAKEKLGSKEAIKIDKSKKSMSETSWGDVDKSDLKKEVLMAKNWRSIVNDVFLKLEEGWEEGKEGSLGYPVMQKKGNTLVYNRYGLASAKAYARKNNEAEVLRKVNSIYKKLGLDKEENALNKEKFSQCGYSCFAIDEVDGMAYLMKDNQLFTHPLFAEEKELEFSEEMVKTMAQVGTEDGEKDIVKMSVQEHEEMKCKMESYEKDKTEMEAKVEEMRCHAEAMEKEKAEMAEKLAEFEKTVEEEKMARFKQEFEDEMEDEEELEEDEKKEMAEKFEKGEYASIIDVKKDIAFRIYTKRPSKKESFSVKINTEQKSKTEPKDIFEEIKELTNKL